MEHDKLYGGETVAKQLYIHYDSVSNHVLTKSIAFHLSALPQSEIPQKPTSLKREVQPCHTRSIYGLHVGEGA